MNLTAGTRLGPYEILSPLGAGGMGEVYKARDTRLERTVAVKVLSTHVATDPQFRERFDREARAISQLDHPHICALYDVGEQAPVTGSGQAIAYLVMQYLEGETLDTRLTKGALPLPDALTLAIQIASALATAHRAGIVHRDVKPANIMLTKTGAKLLDFGLAKSTSPVVAGAGFSMLPTTPPNLTAEGTILGTFQYMAPEQLEGREADARTDLFAFGAVVYEMMTGRKAFQGKSQASLISAIMSSEPTALSALQPLTPPALDRLVQTCLAKDPDARWQSADDLARELKWAANAPPALIEAAPAVARRRGREWIAWSAAAVGLLAALALGIAALRQPPPADTPAYRTTILPPDGAVFSSAGNDPAYRFALSPDGRRLAFIAKATNQQTQIWIRPLDQVTAQPLTGTEGATGPFWSPDSRYIAFFAQGKLKKIAADGGPPLILTNASQDGGITTWQGGTWSRDDVILLAPPRSGLVRVSASGGALSPVTVLESASGEFGHLSPFFLPDGRHFLYMSRGSGSGSTTVGATYVGTLDSQERKQILTGVSNTAYARGVLFFLRNATLIAQPFDLERLELNGQPMPLAERVETGGITGALGAFAVSESGVLAYQTTGGDLRSQLTWFDRTGKQLGTVGEPADQMALELTRDTTRLAVSVFDPAAGGRDIWIHDLTRQNVRRRATFDPADEPVAIWSPDGSRFLFNSSRKGILDLYQQASTGGSAEALVLADNTNSKFPSSWSADGKFALYTIGAANSETGTDLWVVPLVGDRSSARSESSQSVEGGSAFPVLQIPGDQSLGRFSPDGRWIAYWSSESGRREIYVMPFAGDASPGLRSTNNAGGGVPVSSTGGSVPRWRSDGKELFYLSADNKLMVATVNGERSTFEVGAVKELFTIHPRLAGYQGRDVGSNYDVSRDGQQFLVNVAVSQNATAPITLVVNWMAALTR